MTPPPSDRPLLVVALLGSLRRDSHTGAVLRAAIELAPPDVRIEPFDLRPIPPYDADEEMDGGPPPVRALKAAIAAADAVLVATPEYNYGMPGLLKNALDHASRPGYRSVFLGKPVAVVSAAPGAYGGVRAQGQVKETLLAMLAEPFPAPQLAFPLVGAALSDGRLADPAARERLARFVADFAAWVRRRAAAAAALAAAAGATADR
jgi:chromate reductase, NAD(P)H dehydrogenase (quinone)